MSAPGCGPRTPGRTLLLWGVVAALVGVVAVAFPLLGAAAAAPAGTFPASPVVRYGGRVALVAVALVAWFLAQSLLGSRAPTAEGRLGDVLHRLTARQNRWLNDHPRAADRLLLATSLGIDACGLFVIGSAVLGESLRPFVALFLVFVFRQLCQALTALPPPEGMIWRSPGFPSLFVTYTVASDFFFSGHTAIAVLAAVEATRQFPAWAAVAVAALAVSEAAAVIVLRAHYTLDVLAAVTATWCAVSLSDRICAACGLGG